MSNQVTSRGQVHTSADSSVGGRSALADTVAVLATFLVLGLLSGLAWWLLVDPAMFTKVRGGGSMGELDLGKRFDPDGWYAVLAAGTGLLAGGLVTWWRSRNYLLTTTLLLLGAALAATVMALTGHLLGPGDPDVALAAAKAGQQVPAQLAVTSKVTYLIWPIAVLVGALMVLWSPPRNLDSAPEIDR